jgi:formylglycine-generating enzyme required for sulfatase activity
MRFRQIIAVAWLMLLCAAPGYAQTPVPLTEQESGLKPGNSFQECENCPEMVVVPAGSFTMGSPAGEKERLHSEGPQHVVTFAQPFAVGKFHVTVDQYKAFVQATGYTASPKCEIYNGDQWTERADRSWRDPGFAQDGTHPVVCITWNDAKAYTDWIAKKTGEPYRLLTEAEFEYAARGQTSPGNYPRFWFGDDDKAFCQNGNGADQKARDSIEGAKNWKNWAIVPCDDGYAYTSSAGHFTPNAFGLYDMAGNAWQWTEDDSRRLQSWPCCPRRFLVRQTWVPASRRSRLVPQ